MNVNFYSDLTLIEFYLIITFVIIPDVLVTNLITKPYLIMFVCDGISDLLAEMKFSITGTPNSYEISSL